MALREELTKQGNWLFRWRSYLPLIMFFIVILGMKHFQYPGHSEALDDIWEALCLFTSFLGLGIRVFTVGYVPKGTSGTNTCEQIADVLNTTGMYSIVRHPLYLGNFIIWMGISMFFHSWETSLIVFLIFWLYYERIIFAEEEYLREKFGERYLIWTHKTPLFIPSFKNWHPSNLTFSFKKVLKNEYKSFFAIIVSFTSIEIIGDLFLKHSLEIDGMWLTISGTGLAIYTIIRLLKKKSEVLEVEGR